MRSWAVSSMAALSALFHFAGAIEPAREAVYWTDKKCPMLVHESTEETKEMARLSWWKLFPPRATNDKDTDFEQAFSYLFKADKFGGLKTDWNRYGLSRNLEKVHSIMQGISGWTEVKTSPKEAQVPMYCDNDAAVFLDGSRMPPDSTESAPRWQEYREDEYAGTPAGMRDMTNGMFVPTEIFRKVACWGTDQPRIAIYTFHEGASLRTLLQQPHYNQGNMVITICDRALNKDPSKQTIQRLVPAHAIAGQKYYDILDTTLSVQLLHAFTHYYGTANQAVRGQWDKNRLLTANQQLYEGETYSILGALAKLSYDYNYGLIPDDTSVGTFQMKDMTQPGGSVPMPLLAADSL